MDTEKMFMFFKDERRYAKGNGYGKMHVVEAEQVFKQELGEQQKAGWALIDETANDTTLYEDYKDLIVGLNDLIVRNIVAQGLEFEPYSFKVCVVHWEEAADKVHNLTHIKFSYFD